MDDTLTNVLSEGGIPNAIMASKLSHRTAKYCDGAGT